MSAIDKILGKKNGDEVICGNCNHGIVQDPESGKWFHISRDTNNLCYFFDPKSNLQCKCEKATPFKQNNSFQEKPKSIREDFLEKHTTQPQTLPLPPDPVPDSPAPENPVKIILSYLADYDLATGSLVLDICKKTLLDKVKIE